MSAMWYPTTSDGNERIREWVREYSVDQSGPRVRVPLMNDRDPGAKWYAVVDCTQDDYWPVDFRRVPCE